jgi:hypothetical protein
MVEPQLQGGAQVSATTPEAAPDYSTNPPVSREGVPVPPALWRGLIAAALAGPILLVVADFTTLFEVTGLRNGTRSVAGHSNHSWAMAVVGLAALPLALTAVRTGAAAALGAIGALGAVAMVIALAVDLPDATATHTVALTFADAHATPQLGFYLETLGAVLLLVAGVGGTLLAAPSRRRRPKA